MRKSVRILLGLLTLLVLLGVTKTAEASHFRYGTIAWQVVDPVNAPLTVEFTVQTAWRASSVGTSNLNFGDGASNGTQTGVTVGSATDAGGLPYLIQEYTATHTYAQAGAYTVWFESCCRISGLENGSSGDFRVEANIDLNPSNTGGVNTSVNAIVQMESGGIRTHIFPAFDPDGDPITCRFATPAECGLDPGEEIPMATGNNAVPTIAAVPGGCEVTWDLTTATPTERYVMPIIIESTHLGVISSTPIDTIVEIAGVPPPYCTVNSYTGGNGQFQGGQGQFSITPGDTLVVNMTGDDSINYPNNNLTMSVTNEPGGSLLTPPDPTNGPKPFNTTFEWSPGVGDEGTTRVVLVNYTNSANLTGSCALNVFVPLCANYGTPCSAGVGACANSGINVCIGANTVCNALPGTPSPEQCGSTVDEDCDGNLNNQCPDSDGDGIVDQVEIDAGSDPLDADSDDDGVLDGMEPGTCVDYAGCLADSDGDGLPNILDPDSDNDGLKDGTEMGLDCSHPDTDVSVGNCIPDADMGATTTDPLNPDTDGGGANDGTEDPNLNGQVDPGEGNPGSNMDDIGGPTVDTDGDGVGDDLEITLGTDPIDADSDDDGVLDGDEPNPSADMDNDGLINVLDPDSDNDLLFDGTEMGLNCNDPSTDPAAMACAPDADAGLTVTSPVNADTDGGGIPDGVEDTNFNGMINAGELDPNDPSDDVNSPVLNVDSDGDGLSDAVEIMLGSNPFDQDADDDGLLDGNEPNANADSDDDGLPNVIDPDSDNDGLFDGLEAGLNCGHPDTDTSVGVCVPDGDQGATTTEVLVADSDGGGVSDGVEDVDLDGVVDACESDPNNAADDVGAGCDDGNECTIDICGMAGCEYPSKLDGTPCTGGICIAGECVLDTQGTASSASSTTATSSSATTTVGSGGAGATTGAGAGSDAYRDGALEGGGICGVSAAGAQGRQTWPAWLLLGLAGLALRRRRDTL